MSLLLVYGGWALAIVFVVSVIVWTVVVISGSVQATRENQRRQRLHDEQRARARDELTKRYKKTTSGVG